MVASTDLTQVWVTDDWKLGNHWAKHILAGMFVTIAMTGLDQGHDAEEPPRAGRAPMEHGTFTVILVGANLLFLTMGSLLWMHAERIGMKLPEATDRLYPLVAMGGSLGPWLGVAFVVGLLASAFSSADSALAVLTTSTCVDVIDTAAMDNKRATQTRQRVHLGMTVLLWLVILAFRTVNDTSVVAGPLHSRELHIRAAARVVCHRHVHRIGRPALQPFHGCVSRLRHCATYWSGY